MTMWTVPMRAGNDVSDTTTPSAQGVCGLTSGIAAARRIICAARTARISREGNDSRWRWSGERRRQASM